MRRCQCAPCRNARLGRMRRQCAQRVRAWRREAAALIASNHVASSVGSAGRAGVIAHIHHTDCRDVPSPRARSAPGHHPDTGASCLRRSCASIPSRAHRTIPADRTFLFDYTATGAQMVGWGSYPSSLKSSNTNAKRSCTFWLRCIVGSLRGVRDSCNSTCLV